MRNVPRAQLVRDQTGVSVRKAHGHHFSGGLVNVNHFTVHKNTAFVSEIGRINLCDFGELSFPAQKINAGGIRMVKSTSPTDRRKAVLPNARHLAVWVAEIFLHVVPEKYLGPVGPADRSEGVIAESVQIFVVHPVKNQLPTVARGRGWAP